MEPLSVRPCSAVTDAEADAAADAEPVESADGRDDDAAVPSTPSLCPSLSLPLPLSLSSASSVAVASPSSIALRESSSADE